MTKFITHRQNCHPPIFRNCHPERKRRTCFSPLLLLVLALTATTFAQKSPTTHFNGQSAYTLTQQYITAAPKRFVNSPGHLKAEEFIKSHFAPEIAKGNFETDSFTATNTPIGAVTMRNYIVRYPGKKDGVIVLASHYETNYPLKDINFVGANDGGSSSALLLEMANQLRGKTREGYSIWLVWDDAEEAIEPDGSGGLRQEMPFEKDSLYGITQLAEKWQADGTLKRIKAFLLADMIGDADLNIEHDSNSTPWLEAVVYEAATRVGYQSHFFARTMTVSDDHLPFLKRGVACADLIDFNYGYNDVFWHTTQDTVDKLSPKSLEIVGNTILETIEILGKMDPLPPK